LAQIDRSKIPDTAADRYARLHYNYTGPHCRTFRDGGNDNNETELLFHGRDYYSYHGWSTPTANATSADRSNVDEHQRFPYECRRGSDEAQASAAWSFTALNVLSLLFNPVVGSASDVRGRRIPILFSLVLYVVPALAFLLVLVVPTANPALYYVANAVVGVSSYFGLVFAAMSDVLPERHRSAGFGVVMAAMYGGYAVGPGLVVLLPSHAAVGIASLAFASAAFAAAVLFLPETIPDRVLQHNKRRQRQQQQLSLTEMDDDGDADYGWRGYFFASSNCWIPRHCLNSMVRPIREISILNRATGIRLIAIGSFFSSMVFASDMTLVIYYMEEQFDCTDRDIAVMFFWLGVAGIVLQGGFLQSLVKCFGEKMLLVLTFLCGTLHNLLYGVATSKRMIFAALILSQATKVNVPVLSSLASHAGTEHEQGRVQGALFAVNAIAYAVGPLSMEYIYKLTEDTMGPGFMFVYAAMLYATGTVFVSFIPVNGADSVAVDGDPHATANQEEPRIPEEEVEDIGSTGRRRRDGTGNLLDPLLPQPAETP